MIEATCSACGTLNRVAEADVPAGAKFVNCSSCKSRVALPVKAAIPAIPKAPLPKVPSAIPPMPPVKPPPPVTAAPPKTPPPTPKTSEIGLADLPAPKPRSSVLGAEPSKPAPRSGLSALEDLPAPRPSGGAAPSLDLDEIMAGTDLPAPAPKAKPGLADLPAPKARAPGPPPAAAAPDISDLPAPKAKAAARGGSQTGSPLDLPAPKGGGLTDLPMPKAKPAPAPAAAPAMSLDLDLPAPKGASDLPAPKGFFDDLPQPARGGGSGPVGQDIAPKGFFDDLPQPGRAKGDSAQPFGGGAMALELGEDDAPIELAEQPTGAKASAAAAFRSSGPGTAPPPMGGPGTAGSFDDLDLSSPTSSETPPGPELGDEAKAVVRFGGGKAAGTASASLPAVPEKAPLPTLGRASAEHGTLELEEPKKGGGIVPGSLQPKKPKEERVNEAAVKAARAKRQRIALIALLGISAAGAGGFYFYKRHAAAQEKADEIDSQLNVARKALVAEDPNHYMRATAAANKVLELDDDNAEALGIAAEASLAGAFADGKAQQARIAKGRQLINQALEKGVTGPALDRAQALSTLTTAPDKAVARLTQLLAKAPKDGAVALYLGWAQAAAGDHAAAVKSFDQALASTPSLKAIALDGRARAKLAQADVEGARADWNAVLAVQKDSIPAQVGIASTLPQSQSQQQEADLLAILARKDIKDADPRAVIAAWVLAGDDALRGRRLDAARERYRKALAVDAKDVSAMTGLAETELLDRKLEVANEQITKALTLAPNDVRGQLVATEIEIRLGKLDTATERVSRLRDRKPPLAVLDQVKLQIVSGKLLEAQNKDEAAIEAYTAAAKLAGDLDLTPTMLAVAKLNDMAKKAEEERNPVKEQEYRKKADELLSALDSKAEEDPQLALTLGVAYLKASNPEKAEGYLRRVVTARPTDADALFAYGKALGLLTKFTEAIEQLKKARDAAPDRSEIALELAITYERNKNDAAAGAIYEELTAKPDAAIETRARAGRYFVRTGQVAKGGEQGDLIVKADPEHAAGHYLKGEGLLAKGRSDEAKREFSDAVRLERDAVYLDGQGRATEAVATERNDLALFEQALNAYKAAAEIDPLLFTSFLGQGRIHVKRLEMDKAVKALASAQQIRAEDPEVAYLLGIAYQRLGTKKDKALAVKWLEFSLARRRNADAAYQLGELYTDPDIDRGGPAQNAYRRAISTWDRQEKEGKPFTAIEEKNRVDALWKLGNVSELIHDEATQKWAWERWAAQPAAKREPVKLQNVLRALATSLKTVGPPPPEPAQPPQ